MIFPPFFLLTQTGEPVEIGEHLKLITENEKTQVIFLQDYQNETCNQPRDIAYVNKDESNFYVHLKRLEERAQSTTESRLHYYFMSDIAGTIFPAFTSMERDG